MENKSAKHISCSNCLQTFSVRDSLHHRGLRCPRILFCGHSACESCIRATLRITNKVICGICSVPTTATHQLTDLSLHFPINIYIVGLLAARQWEKEPEDSVVTFAASSASSIRKAAALKVMQQNKTEACAECGKFTAQFRCHQCEAVYCGQCFTKVHLAARALSKHQKSPIDENGLQPEFLQSVCEDHPLQALEFFCKECRAFVCSHCVICLHHGHEIFTRKQKNEEDMTELDGAKDRATVVLKRLLHSQQKVRDICSMPGVSMNAAAVEQDMSRYFMNIHGLVQRLQHDLLSQLKKAKTEKLSLLDSITTELNVNIKHVRQLLQEAVATKDPANIHKVDVSAVAEKLLALEDLPIHFVANANHSPAKFIVNEKATAKLPDLCKLEIPTASSYSLVKSEDLPPDFVLDAIDEDSENDVMMSVSSRTSSVSAMSDISCPSSEQAEPGKKRNSVSSAETINTPTSIVKGSSEIVRVCHFRDPSDFYVQRVADTAALATLCKQLRKHAYALKTPPEAVLKDGLYVAQFHVDGKWYRARARNILPRCEKTKEISVDVIYVDYGNSEIIPCSKLRHIPPRFVNIATMALHCSLFGLVPCNGRWSQEALKSFVRMVNGKDVKMVVMDHTADTYQVDLCQLHSSTQETDVPISVRDALVFLEYGCFVADIKPKVHVPQGSTKYFKEVYFKKGDTEDIVVSHIESPHSLYIQRLGEHARYLTSIMKEMNVEYTNAGDKGLIYVPYVGMPCAAKYTVDNRWYRAQVVDLPGNRMVEVFYVDYGNQEVMAWSQIRKMQKKFLRLPGQAIHCSLSDIVPMQQQWVPAAKEYLIKEMANKALRLYVDEVQKPQLKVTLYESQPDVDICVNALLVREGYATSVGVSSSLVEYRKTNGLQSPSPQSSTKQTKPKVKKRSAVNVKSQHTGGAGNVAISTQSKVDTCETVQDLFRLEVKVLSCLSPSCIYVALLIQEEQINNLMRELQEYYATSHSYTDNWEVNNKCCVFSVQYKQWYRAIIVELLPDSQAKVFLKDIAELEIVPLLNLQLLDPKFLATRDGAVKCHLAGIQAAGDKHEWPILACEYLNDQIAKYPHFYITKKGDIENWSLPVELWVKQVNRGGPLDPTLEEWLTLNKKLVEQGLAIPIRWESEVQSIPSLQVLKELEEQGQNANENNVSQWLQLSLPINHGPKTASDDLAPDVKCADSVTDTEGEAEAEQDEQSLPPAISEWLPPLPLCKMKFIATPTYVDDDCFIYLHDTQESADTLTVIGNALLSRFEKSQPKPHDLYWFVGQLCIAQYHTDKKWYRGKVVGVNDDRTVRVAFVDYGNIEDCKATEMRKNVYMSHIPIQCHKCVLDRVKPASEDGKWPVSTLDFIHATIVEKQCQVTVKQEPKIGQPLVISLIGPGNTDIAELLVRMQFAIYSSMSDLDTTPKAKIRALNEALDATVEDDDDDDPEVIIESEGLEVISEDVGGGDDDEGDAEEEEKETENFSEDEVLTEVSNEGLNETDAGDNEQDFNDMPSLETCTNVQWNDLIDKEEKELLEKAAARILQYKQLALPHSDAMAVEVTTVLSATEVILCPCKVKGSELWEVKEEFERMMEDLQDKAYCQPLVKRPYVGQPCCAQYAEDAQWYRAIVLAVESDESQHKLLKIQYVDYGNVEHKPIDKVHLLKPEWAAVPKQGLRCRMWHIQQPDGLDQKALFLKLRECFNHSPLIAKIKVRQPLLQVELYTSDASELILQPLLDAGLLRVEKEEQ